MHSVSITDPFSSQRLELVEDFFNVLRTRDVQKILQMWRHHSVVLKGSHGIFAVDDAPYERPDLPGNRDFGSRGFLRCWMSSNRLLLIQNQEGSRDYRYKAWINCDTNFVSFCEAFQAGRDLDALSDSFRDSADGSRSESFYPAAVVMPPYELGERSGFFLDASKGVMTGNPEG